MNQNAKPKEGAAGEIVTSNKVKRKFSATSQNGDGNSNASTVNEFVDDDDSNPLSPKSPPGTNVNANANATFATTTAENTVVNTINDSISNLHIKRYKNEQQGTPEGSGDQATDENNKSLNIEVRQDDGK